LRTCNRYLFFAMTTMVPDLHSLGIDRLTVKERLQLIGDIWDTIPDPPAASDLPSWHEDVVMDRLKTLKEGKLLTWEEVRERAGLDK